MKKLLLAVILLGFSISSVFAQPRMSFKDCDTKPIKIAENNVEWQYILYDKDGKEKIIKTESYGETKITTKLAKVNSQIADWNDVVWVKDYVADQLAKLTKLKDKFEALKAEIEK